ncbi:MAG TPA: CdaR family protein [Vicinamibacteria bacterium]
MRAFFGHLPLKALSLVLAVLLWFVIAGEKSSEIAVTVPVELQNFPPDLELTSELVNAVEVRLRASPGIIRGLSPGEVAARMDVSGFGEGQHIIQLTTESIRVPFGVRVVKIKPPTISVNLERTVEKMVPVRPRVQGRPAPSYEVGEVASEPAEVRVAGPRSRVQAVESAFTEPVNVQGAETTAVEYVNLGLEDPFVRIEGAHGAKVTVRVREVQARRSFDGLPVGVRGGTGTPRPPRVTVVLVGPASAVRGLAADDVRAYVDLTHVAAGDEVAVAVELAPGHTGVTVESTDPPTVTVHGARSGRR